MIYDLMLGQYAAGTDIGVKWPFDGSFDTGGFCRLMAEQDGWRRAERAFLCTGTAFCVTVGLSG